MPYSIGIDVVYGKWPVAFAFGWPSGEAAGVVLSSSVLSTIRRGRRGHFAGTSGRIALDINAITWTIRAYIVTRSRSSRPAFEKPLRDVIGPDNSADPGVPRLPGIGRTMLSWTMRSATGSRSGERRASSAAGSPIDTNDLEIASPHEAKSIIVLPPENSDPDTDVIKTVLAFTNNPNRHKKPYHIVTQIRKSENLSLIRIVSERDNVQTVFTEEIIARVVAQTSRQSGLSVVYTKLMNFGGDEIYFKNEPALTGKTFGEALLMYEDSCVLGLRRMKEGILLNPGMDMQIESGDQVIAISEDDDTIRLANSSLIPVNEQAIRSGREPHKPHPEKCLILGWNRRGAIIVRELDNYVPKGSLVTIVADVYGIEKQLKAQGIKLVNQKLDVRDGDTTDRALLNELKVVEYDHVIVLAYSTLEPQEADAKTLVTLLHLRDMADKDETPFSIVSEMLDLRNRELAEAAVSKPSQRELLRHKRRLNRLLVVRSLLRLVR